VFERPNTITAIKRAGKHPAWLQQGDTP